MTNEQRKRIFRLCQDDPCYSISKDRTQISILHNGVKMIFSYDPKHDCGTGRLVAIRLADNDYTKQLTQLSMDIVDKVLLGYLADVTYHQRSITAELSTLLEELTQQKLLAERSELLDTETYD